MGGVGGWFLEYVPPTPPLVRVRVKVGVRFIFWFMGEVGASFASSILCVKPQAAQALNLSSRTDLY